MVDGRFYNFQEGDGGGGSSSSRGKGCCTAKTLLFVFVVLFLGVVAALIGVTVHFTNKDSKAEAAEVQVTSTQRPVPSGFTKIDCYPDAGSPRVRLDRKACETRNCVYDETGVAGEPQCYYSESHGYKVSRVIPTDLGVHVYLDLKQPGPFGNDFKPALFVLEMLGDNIVRFKFDDPQFKRYTVPMNLNLPAAKPENSKYDFRITDNATFAFQIIRKSTGRVLWDTGAGGLTLSDQFLQISTKLPSSNIYGFGENLHKQFRHDLNDKTWPMFSRDQAPSHMNYSNLYGVHPFYMCMEGDGNAHGVFLLNSNAQDYSFTNSPMLTWRTIGGVLDFYVFLGPEPETVIQQYTGVIGHPQMPAYWALGFHMCKYGYNNLSELQAAVNRTRHYNIPQDVQYADIDAMDESKDFTLNTDTFAGLPEYFRLLQKQGLRTVIILDPILISNETNYEPYTQLTAVEGAVKWPGDYNAPESDKDKTNAVLGYVWPKGKSVVIDYFNDRSKTVWKNLIVKHRQLVPFDGVWIDMNEPANFGTNEERPFNWPEKDKPYWSLKCPSNQYDDPPYRTAMNFIRDSDNIEGRMSDSTICMVASQGSEGQYRHYDVHSLYGWSQTQPTLQAAQEATGERSLVLSRSTFAGSGRYAGHWLGDNDATWDDMRTSIIGMLEFNLFGIPFVGADICGFWKEPSPELCLRWMQLGAFYPFSRNHNGIDNKPQDPGYFGEDVAEASRLALETRYKLLPYLYTLFHRAHVNGGTVARSLLHEFPEDTYTYGIDTQFLWGSALMVVPILEQGQTVVSYYLPKGQWYDYHKDYLSAVTGPVNTTRTVDMKSEIGLFVRGGYILPSQTPALTTNHSRSNKLQLLVALDETGSAAGDLFWDDGRSIDTYESGKYFHAEFKVSQKTFTMTILHNNEPETDSLVIEKIKILGVQGHPEQRISLRWNSPSPLLTSYSLAQTTLTVEADFPLNQPLSFIWSTATQLEMERHDCYPESFRGVDVVTKEKCEGRGCIFDESSPPEVPSCFFPQEDYGYKVVGDKIETPLGFEVLLQHKSTPSPFGPDIEFVKFAVEMRGDTVIRFMFDDWNTTDRYKVPMELNLPSAKPRDPRYEFIITNQDPFAFQIKRRSNNRVVLWDTGVGGLTFADQFLQISTRLPSRYVYGFGENVHHSFRHDLRYKSWPMFSRDQPVGWGSQLNHYGVHPFYMCMENNGQAHGVLLLNSNAQDYSMSPQPMLTYRTIGGILDFYMFLGPEPESVVQQYTEAIGKPYMPPYWSLGFQLCRYGYNNLTNLQNAVERTKAAQIPHDIQYADIDHMDERKDFTIDPVNFAGLKEYFQSLQDGGMHTIIILDPCLISNETNYEPYEKMKGSNIMWLDTADAIPAGSADDDNSVLGYVWPKGKIIFPDFFKNKTQEVWKELIAKHHQEKLPFDGLWIDMNEPANFGTNEEKPFNWPEKDKPYWSLNCTLEGNTLEHPPYRTMAAYTHDGNGRKAMLSDKTMCMRAVQGETNQYRHYDVHSLYGWSQTQSTLDGLRQATGERGIVISRSTFPGSGKHAGHWLGDNDSLWEDMRLSIIGMLEFNLFGIPYIGADICGFFGDTKPELCKRWMQLGAFNTFFRNHNGLGNTPQDPGALGEDVMKASRKAVETRYWMLPYLYTLFHHAHVGGATVIRPLHHEFPLDRATYDIDRQFLWGPALLISPILEQGQTSLSMYLPGESDWYDFYMGEKVSNTGYNTIPVNQESQIPLHIRSGFILPLQAPANNTHYSRMKPFTLKVALDDSENLGRGYRASGDLYWDDGVSIDTYENGQYYYSQFKSQAGRLEMTVVHNTVVMDTSLYIENVVVMGAIPWVDHVYVNGTAHTNFSYNSTSKVLEINGLNLPLKTDASIEWRQYRYPTEEEKARIDCAPDYYHHGFGYQSVCENRGCVYQPIDDLPDVPDCYINQSQHGYTVKNDSLDNFLIQRRNGPEIFGKDIGILQVIMEEVSNDVFHFKIVDPSTARYEVPVEFNDLPAGASSPQYITDLPTVHNSFFIKVQRKSTARVLFDTSIGGFKFAEQFLQIATKLPSENVYGLGENRHFTLRHSFDYETWPMFSRDNGVNWGDYANLYGVHPFYMCIEPDGNAHAVLLVNSNAMEAALEPGPRLTYRTIGGILDFYVFLGPSPEAAIQQYTQLIGKPYMPPYWSLGFQLCQYGYNSLDNLKAAVSRTRAANIPHDVQYADIDHMDERRDFTIDQVNFAGLPEYVEELQGNGMHFIIILDPALISNNSDYKPYDQGLLENVFIRWPTDVALSVHNDSKDVQNSMLGYVWPKGKVVFPDFFLNRTQEYWKKLIVDYHDTIKFDGLWIDMNEPANFGTNEERPFNWPEKDMPYWSLNCSIIDDNDFENPPYKPRSVYGSQLSDKTLCMYAEQADGKYNHYDVHSVYGWSQTKPTLEGLQMATGKRGMVISRSTYPSSGKYTGHWLGDNDSKWSNLHDSIIGIIEFNLFGIPYIGADICGFFGDTTPELCERWMQLGAFYTFSRNHNTIGSKPQDPAVFGTKVAESSRRALEIRYSLLPYLYTLFYQANTLGGTVIRSMAHEFPADSKTWTVDTQFMWGSALLIAPVLEQNQVTKDVYFPASRWFDYYTGREVIETGRVVTVSAPHDFIPLYLHGGNILPTQSPANNTVYSRQNPMGLIVVPDNTGGASGSLFWDDGDSQGTIENGNYFLAEFTLTNSQLKMGMVHNNTDMSGLQLDTVWVYGVGVTEINSVSNGNFTFNKDTQMLVIDDLGLPLTSNFTLTWS